MNPEDLKLALAALDRRLHRIEPPAESESITRTRRSLLPLAYGQWLQAAVGFAAVLLGVAAWRSDSVHFGAVFASGVVVHVYGVAMIALACATRLLLARIDPSGPVLAMQRRLAEMRRLAIVAGYVLGMSWWFLWVPFAIVVFRVAVGGNLGAVAPDFTVVLVGVGAAGFLASTLVHRWAAATGRTRLAALFDNALTGTSLRDAQVHLDEVARFVRD